MPQEICTWSCCTSFCCDYIIVLNRLIPDYYSTCDEKNIISKTQQKQNKMPTLGMIIVTHWATDFYRSYIHIYNKKESTLHVWNMAVQSTLYKTELFQSNRVFHTPVGAAIEWAIYFYFLTFIALHRSHHLKGSLRINSHVGYNCFSYVSVNISYAGDI